MSEMAKKARAALKEKAKRLGSDRPVQKVDSSTFVPPELLEADVKTGLRPISRRAYKSGGKVEGACAPTRADRKPRKSGGEASSYANAKINRNVKAANEEREGKKHIGGMNKGGRAGYKTDGKVESDQPVRAETLNKMTNREYRERLETPSRRTMEIKPTDPQPSDLYDKDQLERLERGYKKGGRTKKAIGGAFGQYLSPALMLANAVRGDRDKDEKKRGGRAKKMDGGLAGDPRTAGNAILQNSAAAAGVPQDRLGFAPNMPSQGVKRFLGLKKGGKAEDYKSLRAKGGTQVMSSAMKKGGEAKHPDEAMDKALIKKMVKPSARINRATGGGTFSGPGYPEKVPGVVPGGRMAKADGGKVKKRIKKFAGGSLGYAMGGMPSRGGSPASGAMGRPMQRPLPGANPLTPTYPAPQPPVTGGPLPMYQPNAPVVGAPMPMYNKGGRVAYKKGGAAKKGKTNINIVIQAGKPDTGGMDVKNPMLAGPVPPPPAPPIMPPPGGPAGGPPPGMPPMPPGGAPGMPPMMGRKAGGRVYRSYKDMDAGAGSGLGRLEKTEIASRSNRKAGGKVYRSYKDMDAGAGSGLGRLEKTEIQRRK